MCGARTPTGEVTWGTSDFTLFTSALAVYCLLYIARDETAAAVVAVDESRNENEAAVSRH